MLRASFPNIKCPNGHLHAYCDAECPTCHEPVEMPKLTTPEFCECGMVRPEIIEIEHSQMTVQPSRFCFMCGKFFNDSLMHEQDQFSY